MIAICGKAFFGWCVPMLLSHWGVSGHMGETWCKGCTLEKDNKKET